MVIGERKVAAAVEARDRKVGLRTLGKGCGAINNCRKIIRIAPIQSQVSKEPYHCDSGSCRNARNCFKSVQPLLKIADHLLGQCTAHTCFNCWAAGADEEQINTTYVNFLDAQACRASGGFVSLPEPDLHQRKAIGFLRKKSWRKPYEGWNA